MRIRLHPVFFLGLAALVAGGCAGTDSAARRQLDELRKELTKVQADNQRLGERLSSLENAAASRLADREHRGTPSGERPPLDVVRLVPGQDESPGAPETSGPEADEPAGEESGGGGGGRTVIEAEGTEAQVHHVSGPATSRTARSEAARRDYEAALRLVKQKKYDGALEALAGFLVRYPSDTNADNAMYWRGECYYAKGDYVRAAEQFEGLVARFPHGNKVPDALLKLGLSQRAMGDQDKAKQTFAQLQRTYPSSEAAKKIPAE